MQPYGIMPCVYFEFSNMVTLPSFIHYTNYEWNLEGINTTKCDIIKILLLNQFMNLIEFGDFLVP